MTISKLDLEFAAVTWMVNQNIDSLNRDERDFIEVLFTQYCDYARGSRAAENKVRELLDSLVGDAKIVRPIVPRVEQAVFGMLGKDKDSSKQIKKERQEIQKSKLIEDVAEKSEIKQEDIMKMLTLIAQGQYESKQMAADNMKNLEKFAETTDSNKIALELQIHNLEKENVEMRKMVQDLYDMQLRKQSLTDLKWRQIPDWFREIYSGGIKKIAVGLVKLPFRIAGIAVDRIIYRPMVRAYDFWGGKVELVVGTVYFIIIIAGVVHIYQTSDWEYVNATYQKYGGEYINRYLFSGTDMLKNVQFLFPDTQEVFQSVKVFFFEKCVSPILHIVSIFWQAMIGLLTHAANVTFSKLPGAQYWYGNAEVDWENNPLLKVARTFFA